MHIVGGASWGFGIDGKLFTDPELAYEPLSTTYVLICWDKIVPFVEKRKLFLLLSFQYQTDRQTDRQKDRQTEGRTDGQVRNYVPFWIAPAKRVYIHWCLLERIYYKSDGASYYSSNAYVICPPVRSFKHSVEQQQQQQQQQQHRVCVFGSDAACYCCLNDSFSLADERKLAPAAAVIMSFVFKRCTYVCALIPVSYTHLTLPTTPYV